MFSQRRLPEIVPLTGDGLSSLNTLTCTMGIDLGNCAAYKDLLWVMNFLLVFSDTLVGWLNHGQAPGRIPRNLSAHCYVDL